MTDDCLSDDDRDAFLAEMDTLAQQLYSAQHRGFGFQVEWTATTAEIRRLDAAGVAWSDPAFVDAVRRHRAAVRAELDYRAGVATMRCPHCANLRHSEPITVHELPVPGIDGWPGGRGAPVEVCFGDDLAAWEREEGTYHSGMVAPNDRFVVGVEAVRSWRFLPGSMVYAASAAGSLRVPLGRVASVSAGIGDRFVVRLRDREPSRRVARIVNLVTDPGETATIEAAGFDTSLWQVGDDIDARPAWLDTIVGAVGTGVHRTRPQFPQLAPASPDRVQRVAGWLAVTTQKRDGPLWGVRLDYTVTDSGLRIDWRDGPFADAVATSLTELATTTMPIAYDPAHSFRIETHAVLAVGGVRVDLHSYDPRPDFRPRTLSERREWRWPQPLHEQGAAWDTVIWTRARATGGAPRAVVTRLPYNSRDALPAIERYAVVVPDHQPPAYSADPLEIGRHTALSNADICLHVAARGWDTRDADEWLDDTLLTRAGRMSLAASMTAVVFGDRAIMRLHRHGLRIEARMGTRGGADLIPAVVLSALDHTGPTLPDSIEIAGLGREGYYRAHLSTSEARVAPMFCPEVL